MRIICDSKEEYISLMKTCKYLHDHGMTESLDCEGLDTEFEKVNYLMHMYLSKPDWPNKHEYISILTGEDIHKIDENLDL